MDRPKKKSREIIVTENDLPESVIRAVEQGHKIEAINLLREATGLGLAHAKVLVDKAARTRGPKASSPGFIEEKTNLGALLKSLLLALLAFIFYRYYFTA